MPPGEVVQRLPSGLNQYLGFPFESLLGDRILRLELPPEEEREYDLPPERRGLGVCPAESRRLYAGAAASSCRERRSCLSCESESWSEAGGTSAPASEVDSTLRENTMSSVAGAAALPGPE